MPYNFFPAYRLQVLFFYMDEVLGYVLQRVKALCRFGILSAMDPQ